MMQNRLLEKNPSQLTLKMREQNHYHKIDAIMQNFDKKLRNSYNSIGTQELLRKVNYPLSSKVLN